MRHCDTNHNSRSNKVWPTKTCQLVDKNAKHIKTAAITAHQYMLGQEQRQNWQYQLIDDLFKSYRKAEQLPYMKQHTQSLHKSHTHTQPVEERPVNYNSTEQIVYSNTDRVQKCKQIQTLKIEKRQKTTQYPNQVALEDWQSA